MENLYSEDYTLKNQRDEDAVVNAKRALAGRKPNK